MSLVWKLMRRHVSVAQLAGFFVANLFGMVIVLLGVQFYQDVSPVLTGGDSFMKEDYLIVSKKVSTLGSLVGSSTTFSDAEIDGMKEQPFAKGVGEFTPSQFKVSAGVSMEQIGLHMSTAMFFESVADRYVDVSSDNWHFEPGDTEIPIIVPRNYLNLYNFGFAQSRSLPQISEGVIHMLSLDVHISGGGRRDSYKGRIAGFSDRLNTILVPESFMKWANTHYADGNVRREPSRLIVEVGNPADERIAQYFREHGYETEADKLDAGKTAWFLKVVVGIVLSVGLLISVLSFYILMLSIYLLLQKNTTKLENLLLIGYGPRRVSFPYQALTVTLNVVVLALSVGVVMWIRTCYLDVVEQLFPSATGASVWPMLVVGVLLFVAVSFFNVVAIRRKVDSIWMHKS